MADNPKINDAEFFALIADEDRRRLLRLDTDFPWQGVTEDREKLKDAIYARYKTLGLNPPRITFSRSPNGAFGALMFLRQMQTNQRQNVITAMTRGGDPLDAEARAVFLESIIDKDITVSLGACLRDSLMPGNGRRLKPLVQLADRLRQRFTPPPNGRPVLAGWRDWVCYPIDYGFNYDIQTQCFCLLPFVRSVYVALPPQFVKTDDEGNLHCDDGPAARWSDGFEIHAHHVDESRLIEAPKPERPKGKSAMEMLREDGLVK